jgi:hypothetical protein
MAFDNYSSHLLVFEKLLASFPVNNALEFGMGKYSTPFLAQRCKSLVSVEQESKEWYDKITTEVRSLNWEPVFECDPSIVFDHFDKLGRKFDLIFSDGASQTRCLIANLAMRRSVPFIVLHDAEKIWYYRWNMLDIPESYYRFNFRHMDGAGKVTAILANMGQYAIDKWQVAEHERVVQAYTSPKQPILEIRLDKKQ